MSVEELITQAEECVSGPTHMSAPEASIILLAEATRRLNAEIKSLEQALAALLRSE